MNHYQELREALGIPQDASHEDALATAGKLVSVAACCAQAIISIPASIDTPQFSGAWTRWLHYRKERRLPQYKPMGLQAQLTKLAKMGAAKAIAAIEFSISQNYQGIYEDRTRNSAGTTRSSQVIGTPDRYRVGPGVHGDIGS